MTSKRFCPLLWCGLIGSMALVLLCGCGPSYPRVHSQESLQLLLALRTACSTQNAERLHKVETALEMARREGKVTEAEAEALSRIIEMARQGNWHQAERACRSFQKAQLR